MSRLTRFLRLERPRPPEGGDADRSDAPRPACASGAALDRFGPEPARPIELAEAGGDERPFTRCMRCEMDHHALATECAGCGARLDTAQQRDFNDRLWARRRDEAAREAAAAAERQAALDRASAELSEARRAMAEELAREVGERERRRLGMQQGWGGWPARLLEILLSPGRRWRRW